MPDRISAHISYREATQSQTAVRRGIKNIPSPDTLERMKVVALACFEPVRVHFGVPIFISSFYRSSALNKAIGGAKSSQHVTGEAIDLDADVWGGVTNAQLFDYIRRSVTFDQLIWEYGSLSNPEWVHVSYRAGNNRASVLRAVRRHGKTSYLPWTA